MLFLHGYLSDKRSFYYQTEYFSKFYKVTAPDIIGFGASSPLESAYSLDDYVNWLKDFIERRKIVKPVILAHSFGARMALKYLSGEKDAADRLIITGGAGLVKRSPQYMRRVKAYRRVKKLFPKFAERHYGSREYRSLSPLMKESYKKIVNEDLKTCASRIEVPTLLIYGKNDTVTPVTEEGETFKGLIKGSGLATMEGGHFCFSEHPEVFNGTVYKYLTEN